jgi:hypothetical protein
MVASGCIPCFLTINHLEELLEVVPHVGSTRTDLAILAGRRRRRPLHPPCCVAVAIGAPVVIVLVLLLGVAIPFLPSPPSLALKRSALPRSTPSTSNPAR